MGSAPELQKLLSHGRGTNVAARRGLPKHISNGPGDFCYVRSAARVHQGWAENLHIPKVFAIAMRKTLVFLIFAAILLQSHGFTYILKEMTGKWWEMAGK